MGVRLFCAFVQIIKGGALFAVFEIELCITKKSFRKVKMILNRAVTID